MSIIHFLAATEERFRDRQQERQGNLARIAQGEILQIAANTPDLVAERLNSAPCESRAGAGPAGGGPQL